VEVKPVGVAFDGTVTCQSGPVSSGTRTQCTVSNLTPLQAYHWQARSVDSAGAVSPWVTFGGNADPAAVDFVVANRPPHAPTGLGLAVSSYDYATFSGSLTDPDGDQPKLQLLDFQVEVKPVGVPFDGTVSCHESGNYNGGRGMCRVTGLTAGQAYHWRARSEDYAGAVSPWVSFGTNADPDGVDFRMQ
jgi:hypothetical protein